MTDHQRARINMVESQLRPNGVTDPRILQAMAEIPRERFVTASLRPLAYMDRDIAFETASQSSRPRHMLSPLTLGRLIHLAAVAPQDLVLDVGCATGYSCAVLARLAEAVVGVECEAALAEAAGATLTELEVDNAAVVTGPLPDGYPEEGPYGVILLNGGVPRVPRALLSQLRNGGRLVTVVGDQNFGQAYLYRNIDGDITALSAFDAGAPALPGFEVEPEFVF